MLEIREIQPEDYDFLWTMLYEAIYSPNVQLPKSIIYETPLANYVASFGQAGDYGFVITNDAALVGAAWVRLLSGESRGYGYVDDTTPELSMAIEPGFRGRGYGRQLLEAIIAKASEVGFTQLSLSVDKRNRAYQLYQRAGFITVKETDSSCTMVRKLNSAG
jgi:GNAT superfamily N-acetyltransferase